MSATPTLTTPIVTSYWEGNGRYQATADALGKLIPRSGPCTDALTGSRHLDRYRRAVNAYYDLFNNGLCNRAVEFRALFGMGAPRLPHSRDVDYNRVAAEGKVEARMDELILKAAKEQGIEV